MVASNHQRNMRPNDDWTILTMSQIKHFLSSVDSVRYMVTNTHVFLISRRGLLLPGNFGARISRKPSPLTALILGVSAVPYPLNPRLARVEDMQDSKYLQITQQFQVRTCHDNIENYCEIREGSVEARP